MKRAAPKDSGFAPKNKFTKNTNMKFKKLLPAERRKTSTGETINSYIWIQQRGISSISMPLKFASTFANSNYFAINGYNTVNERVFVQDYSTLMQISSFDISNEDNNTINKWLQPDIMSTVDVLAGLQPPGTRTTIRGVIKRIDEQQKTENSTFASIRLQSIESLNTGYLNTIKIKFWREVANILNGFVIGDNIIVKNIIIESFNDNIFCNSMVDTMVEYEENEINYNDVIVGASFVMDNFSIMLECETQQFEVKQEIMRYLFPRGVFTPDIRIQGVRTPKQIKTATILTPPQPEQAEPEPAEPEPQRQPHEKEPDLESSVGRKKNQRKK